LLKDVAAPVLRGAGWLLVDHNDNKGSNTAGDSRGYNDNEDGSNYRTTRSDIVPRESTMNPTKKAVQMDGLCSEV